MEYRASLAAERCWFMEQAAVDGAPFNLNMGFRLAGNVDSDALTRAVQVLVERHAALRTTLHLQPDALMARVSVRINNFLEWHDLRDAAEAGSCNRQERFIERWAAERFDMELGPLFKAAVLRVSSQECVLLLKAHHAILDGASSAILLDEMGELYCAATQLRPPDLRAPDTEYEKYALAQRSALATGAHDDLIAYWVRELTGAPQRTFHSWPSRAPARRTDAGGLLRIRFPKTLRAGIEALRLRARCSLFTTMLTAFQVLIARMAGEADIVVGVPVSARNELTERSVGCFLNVVPVRTRVDGAQPFAQLLLGVRERLLAALDHSDLPFELLVAAVAPSRSAGTDPLCQVWCAMQPHVSERLRLPGIVVSECAVHSGGSRGDIGLILEDCADRLEGWIEYSTDLFDASAIGRLVMGFTALLEGVVADPETPVSRLPIVGATEGALLREWNRTELRFPPVQSLVALFEQQARRTPEATAVIYESVRLSYAELDVRANKLAQCLCARGVGPESIVGVCLERSLELIVGVLAVLKAGAAYLPLDAQYPAERLAFMLDDVRASLVLTQQSLLECIPPQHRGTAVCLDGQPAFYDVQSGCSPGASLHPQGLAYVIYTSGSTGTPKGVAITHEAIVNRLRWAQAEQPLSGADRILQKTAATFDVSVWELFWPISYGATLVFARPDGHRDPRYLMEAIDQYEITVVHFVPSMLAAFLAFGAHRGGGSLRHVICSGEALSAELCARVLAQYTAVRLHNLYGPTEAAIDVSRFECERGGQVCGVPIGRPVANTQLYVLDGLLEAVPVGVVGELYAGGVQLARGYLRRPSLTAERFIANPYGRPGTRLYRTGDLARYREDGNLEYVGRIDHQVKLRGFRIELGEIEAVLRAHPNVRDAAVLAQETSTAERHLVGYVVGDRQSSIDIGDVRAYLRERLPEYMVPASLVELEALPLTASGKVDRRALPAVGRGEIPGPESYVPPRTPTEQALAAIWLHVLEVERVGLRDDFFALGGHSLLATRVVSRIRQELGIDLGVRLIFEHPTVERMAAQLERQRREQHALQLPPLKAQARAGSFVPMSFAQERLWFLEQLGSLGSTYHMPTVLRLSGELNVRALSRGLAALMERHESLRTRFAQRAGVGVQVIEDCCEVHLQEHDLSALEEPERALQQEQLTRRELLAPFDLSTAPLLRAQLLKLSPLEHVLQLTLHHVVSDGWSAEVLIRELGQLYEAYRQGRDLQLPALPVQYADYAQWQRGWLQGEALQQQLQYWKVRLRDAPGSVDLPTDRPRPVRQSFRGAVQRWSIKEPLSGQLRGLARAQGVTLYMLLLGALQVLLSRWSGQKDIVVGSPIAGRTHRELEGLVGFFVNTLVLRGQLGSDPRFSELLVQVKETALGAYAHQDVPFEKLVQELQPQRDLSRAALFQVCFTYQLASQHWEWPGLHLQPLALDSPSSKFDLSWWVMDRPQAALEGAIEYATDLFDASTIERLIGCLNTLLEGVVADPHCRISQLPLVPAGQRRLLREWNRPQAVVPRTQHSLSELFAEQVRRTPEATAVMYEGSRLSYAELDGRANQLARHLRGQGVGPESIVAVCMERSLELVVSLLGVLKAGGAYLPLDPQYPSPRLNFMLEDLQVRTLLTQQSLRDRVPAQYTGVLTCVDSQWGQQIAHHSPEPLEARVHPQTLAYVIYTSGSTGEPKAVGVTHRCVERLFRGVERCYEFGSQDVWTLFHSYAFDFSVWELWGALLYGGRLVIVPYWVSRSPQDFYDLLVREQVTILSQTPAAFSQLVGVDEAKRAALSLRWVIFGGEALNIAELSGWYERHAPAQPRLVNMYGITETTVHVSLCLLGTAQPPPAGTVGSAIGRPLPDLQVYVLDECLQEVPIGVIGELYVGGEALARGYLRRAGLTAERFLANPYGEAGTRLYRTGDLGRYRESGDLEYIGRSDRQVKIRGFRIELGEVEAALRSCAGVHDAVVVARPQPNRERQLVAYVVRRPEAAVDVRELREQLALQLPQYMMPAFLIVLEELPLTANGKVDRQRLAATEVLSPVAARSTPARTVLERRLAPLWEQVLNIAPVGVHDNFFELGGDSMLMVQLLARVNALGMRPLTVVDLFAYPTVAQVASHLETLQTASTRDAGASGAATVFARAAGGASRAASVAGPVRSFALIGAYDRHRLPSDVEDAYPLTQMQLGMLYHMEMTGEGGFLDYQNVDSYCCRLGAAFIPEHFQSAVDKVVQRHPVLRTSFDLARFSEPLQLVHAHAHLRVGFEDLRALPAQEQEARIRAYVRTQATSRFDSARAPLHRVHVHLRESSLIQLSITDFHPILDGWSLHIIMSEILSAYTHLVTEGTPDARRAPTSLFREYVRAEREAASSEESLAFWRADLRDAPRTRLARRPRTTGEGCARRRYSLELPRDLVGALRHNARQWRVPLKTLMLASHLRVLATLAGTSEVLSGVISQGRLEEADGERACGMFLNTVPLRMRVEAEPWRDFALRVFSAEVRMAPHRRVPLTAINRALGGKLVLDALFNYADFHIDRGRAATQPLPQLAAELILNPNSVPLAVTVLKPMAANDHLVIFEYHDDVADADDIAGLGQRYVATLEEIASPWQPTSALGQCTAPACCEESSGATDPGETDKRERCGAVYVPGRTALEKQLIETWQEVLGVPQVGINDRYCEHGGDSLALVRLLAKINAAGPRGITMRDLLERPTVAELAEHMEALQEV